MDNSKDTDTSGKVITSKLVNDYPEEKRFGYWRWKPSCWQFCNNPKGFVVVYCLYIAVAGIVNGVVYTNVGAIEQRFRLTSSQSAVIVIGYDIGFCAVAIFVTFFGDRFNRARAVAIGAALYGLGCLIYAIPHYTSPLYSIGEDKFTMICNSTFEAPCGVDDDFNSSFATFFVATLFMGVGLTPALTLGLSYVEDSVSQQSASLYLAFCTSAFLLGPMIGFLSGGVFLSDYFVDFDSNSGSQISNYDPRWVGAWWVLPLITMALCWIFVIPLFGFPKQLPGTAVNRALRVSEAHKHDRSKSVSKKDFGSSIRHFPMSFFTLLKNPTYVLITIANCFQAINDYGYAAFITILIANNFHVTLGKAAELTGAVIVLFGIVGTFAGGLIVNRFNWTPKGMLRFCAGSVFVAALTSPAYLLSCDNKPTIGITVPRSDGLIGNLTASCNEGCNCQGEYFVSSCSSEGEEYFSPCHAGCTEEVFNETLGTVFYTNCTCTNSNTATLVPEGCSSECNNLAIFLVVSAVATFSALCTYTPVVLATLRVVPEPMRSFGIGVQLMLIRVLGTIPGPILYGTLIDQTCVYWQTLQCDGSQGFCYVHSTWGLALVFLTINLVCSSLAALSYLLAAIIYKPISSNEEGGQQDQSGHDQKDIPAVM